MSNDLYIDLELDGHEEDPIIQTPTQPPIEGPTQRAPWFTWLLMVLCAGLIAWQCRGCTHDWDPPGPAPTPIVVERPAVLFAITEDMTPEQGQVCASQIVQKWCDDNGVDYRRYQVGSPLDREETQWQEMMSAAKSGTTPNMVTVNQKGVGLVHDIPATPQDAIEILKELK